MFSSYQVNVPQLFADIDRTKALQLGVPVTDVFDTLQIYLGSLYVNDFNKFGRTYQVRVQADAPFRARADDIGQLKVRSHAGDMVPLSALLKVDADARAGSARSATTASCRRHQRRSGTRLLVGPGAGGGRADRGRNAAAAASPSNGPT